LLVIGRMILIRHVGLTRYSRTIETFVRTTMIM
jgi:hypothetical protein